jgi:IS5 family transposase
MAAAVWETEALPEELFWLGPDSELKQVLGEALDLTRRQPAILARIAADQDAVGLAKKQQRQADARWQAAQTAWLPGLPEVPDGAAEPRPLRLELGRPRMPAEVVFVLFVLQGYLGSVTDRAARDLLAESRTLQQYLAARGQPFPGWTTILENVNAISLETRDFILDAQLAMIREDGLDDFAVAVVDSTAVQANSAWPTDGGILLGLLERAFRASQKLARFGLPNLPRHWVPRGLRRLRRHLLQINLAGGKRDAERQRQKHYRRLLAEARQIINYLQGEYVAREPLAETRALPPSQQQLLGRLWEQLGQDLVEAVMVHEYCEERLFAGGHRPAREKKLSLADPQAAYIEKGNWQAVIGYRPQVARSANGFVSALTTPEGNAADAPQLLPLVQQAQRRSGVQPCEVIADDGYADATVRQQLLAGGVERVTFTGAKGQRMVSALEWHSPLYQRWRGARSAVESLIFVLKHVFAFGRLRRRGLEAVRAELLEKVIAHNFYRLVLLRARRAAAARRAA